MAEPYFQVLLKILYVCADVVGILAALFVGLKILYLIKQDIESQLMD